MKIKISKSFSKVVDKLSGKQLDSVLDVIREVKSAESIEDITDCTRLVGYLVQEPSPLILTPFNYTPKKCSKALSSRCLLL